MIIAVTLALSLTQNLINRLPNVVFDELDKMWDVDKNIRSLDVTIKTMQRKIDELENEELSKAKWRPWISNLVKVLLEADDLIDSLNLELQKIHYKTQNEEHESNTSCCFSSTRKIKHPGFRSTGREIALSFKKMCLANSVESLLSQLTLSMAELETISGGRRRGELNSPISSAAKSCQMKLQTHIDLTEGRKKDKELILTDFLLNPSFQEPGVSIFGMAGSGKTTLAASILQDSRINRRYKHLTWVEFRGSFHSNDMIFRDHEGHLLIDVDIGSLLQREGNMLFVLDDIWDVQYHHWRDSQFFKKSGLTLLITTRDPWVAKTTATMSYRIKECSHPECKCIIDKQLPPNVEIDYITSNLSKLCCGLPLVAKLLGQTIASKCRTEESTHEAVSRFTGIKDLWDLEVYHDIIFPSLKFNEPCLPSELSECLAFMTLFPDDYPFEKNQLAQVWLACGFLPLDDKMSVTQWLTRASDYVDALSQRSVLQVSYRDRQDELVTYKMHRLFHGFAQSLPFNTCLKVEGSELTDLNKQIAHVSLCCETISNHILAAVTVRCKRLRSLLLLDKSGADFHQVPNFLFSELRYLRLVNLSNTLITHLPDNICSLKHLRCLDASNSHLEIVNDKICNLFGLQILRLKSCPFLLHLPYQIMKLVNLIFLEVDNQCLRSTPPHIGSLINLQALELYVVKRQKGKRICELGKMNDLKGSITIEGLENVEDGLEASKANLCQKAHLKGLVLQWTKTSPTYSLAIDAQNTLTALEPNEGLQDLKLICYNGNSFPSWLTSSTRNLRSILLSDCPLVQDLSLFWKLPYLNNLFLDRLPKIERIDRTFLGDISDRRFIRLESLQIQNLENLNHWDPMVPGDFPCLRCLTIKDCPRFDVMPSFEDLPQLFSAKFIHCGQGVQGQ